MRPREGVGFAAETGRSRRHYGTPYFGDWHVRWSH
jgi:hypothetical protein